MNSGMIANRTVTVFGAYGHTGRFVVSELHKRGFSPVLSGREAAKLEEVAKAHPGAEVRVATVGDPASLDRALCGAAAVINCAGPFLDTAVPVIKAALRAQIHYLDIAAEQAAVIGVFEHFAVVAQDVNCAIVPAMAFFGGLGDLLATAAIADWTAADEICIAVALDRWHPTRGTRITGERNTGPRFFFSNNRLERRDAPPMRVWDFPSPFGTQDVANLSFAESMVIPRHLRTPEIHAYMNLAPIKDVRNPETPAPTAADQSGRSSQTFLIEAVVRRGSAERHAVARGRDIYAITAPIVVEATQRLVTIGGKLTGVVAAGEIFDARDFLSSLSPRYLTIDFQ
jgi:hypothetical protein